MRTQLWLAFIVGAGMSLTGCDSVDKAEAYAQKMEKSLVNIERKLEKLGEKPKKGIACDNGLALETLKSLMDKNSDGEYAVDKQNIVIWDYNSVGRYTCKVKVKKIADKNPLGKDINAFLSKLYGLHDGGWVHYHTYITTQDENNFYVGIDMKNNK